MTWQTPPWLREQRRFAGVPTELFVNPPGQVRRYFASEHASGKPSTAHMLATGKIAVAHPVIDELVHEARDWLSRPVEALARHVIGVDSFFDWSSDREPVAI